MKLFALLCTLTLVLLGCSTEVGVTSEDELEEPSPSEVGEASSEVLLSAPTTVRDVPGLTASGRFVLVDSSLQPIPSDNSDFPIFVLDILAFEQRDGTTAFDVTYNNASEELSSGSVFWQCSGTQRGILTPSATNQYLFEQDAEADSDIIGFDLPAGPECDSPVEPDINPAAELFRASEPLLFGREDNGISITSSGTTWLFIAS